MAEKMQNPDPQSLQRSASALNPSGDSPTTCSSPHTLAIGAAGGGKTVHLRQPDLD